MWVATTDQQARMFALVTSISELFRDGNRDPLEVLRVLQTIKEHQDFMTVLGVAAQPNLRYDKRRDGLWLLHHAPRSIMSMADIEVVPFLRGDEKLVRGYDMIGRAWFELGADLGQEDAEFILEHQDEIPVWFRQFHLLFPRSVWLVRDNSDLFVPYLLWNGERWHLNLYWLANYFHSSVRLARSRK